MSIITLRTVLVTDAESRQATVVIKSLGRRGYHIIAGSYLCDAQGFYSRYAWKRIILPNPQTDVERYLSTIERLSKYVDVLFPIQEFSQLPIARNLASYEKEGLKVIITNYEALKIAMSKSMTLKVAKQLNIPIPFTTIPETTEELKNLMDYIKYPVILKLQEEHGIPPSRRYKIVYNRQELLHAYRELYKLKNKPPLLQEYIQGTGLGVFMIFNKYSELLAWIIHQRILENPPTGGPSAICQTAYHGKALLYAYKLLKKLSWCGPVMVEFRVNRKTKKPYLMEINPRFWGSSALPIFAGLDLPYLLVTYWDTHVKECSLTKRDYKYTKCAIVGEVFSLIDRALLIEKNYRLAITALAYTIVSLPNLYETLYSDIKLPTYIILSRFKRIYRKIEKLLKI